MQTFTFKLSNSYARFFLITIFSLQLQLLNRPIESTDSDKPCNFSIKFVWFFYHIFFIKSKFQDASYQLLVKAEAKIVWH